MENINQTSQPNEKKSSNDFVKLVIGIVVFIIVLVALKYLVSALGII
jgi:flagellar basal body-associated protein FliL